jgi:hypothetical protein
VLEEVVSLQLFQVHQLLTVVAVVEDQMVLEYQVELVVVELQQHLEALTVVVAEAEESLDTNHLEDQVVVE